MVGRTLSHYKILEELSRGGMGIVYRALDLKLDREVALKVLPPELVADPERKRRFVQEAKAAAKLNHPHIGMVFEIDDADGTTFIAMEIIEGEKLKDLINKERLPLSRALELATEVAEGLARAHDKGIVHRDLKPANIMVTEDGHAKIIDFGLAKLVEPLEGVESDIDTLTKGGTDPDKVMGTVSYMSPEQARGKKLDHRSDIFSFGIVLHEMLTGLPPFQGQSGIDTLNAILHQPAPRLPSPPDGTADEVQRILDKCLAKDPADRYQGLRDLVVDLRTARRRQESGSVSTVVSPVRRPSWRLLGVAALAALLLAGALLVFLKPFSQDQPKTTGSRPSLAVLFFQNNTGDPSMDWLRTAIADMLVTDLSQSPRIEVLGTDRLYQILRDMNRLDDRITSFEVVQEVADRGHVDTVLVGNFVKAGESIRISVRLQEAESGKILTTETVEGVGESSLFPMVDDLTRRIKSNFEIPATADGELDRDLKDVTTSSIEAYRFYAEGNNLHELGEDEAAVPLLDKAVEIDPEFAMALAKLAIVHGNLYHARERDRYMKRALDLTDHLSPRERLYIEGAYYAFSGPLETYWRGVEAFEKCTELYPNHAVSRYNLANEYVNSLERCEDAVRHLEELIRRGDPYPGTHANLAFCLAIQGEIEKGFEVLQAFLRENPSNATGYQSLGMYLATWRSFDQALEAYQQVESLDPEFIYLDSGRWRIYVATGQWDPATAAAKKLASSNERTRKFMGLIRLALLQLYQGRSHEALAHVEQAAETYPEGGTMTASAHRAAARVLLAIGEPARALRAAEKAHLEDADRWVGWEVLFEVARAQAELGRWDEATRTAVEHKRIADLIPAENARRNHLALAGELARIRGDTASALEHLTRAQAMLPASPATAAFLAHVPIWYALASAYMAASEEDAAAEYFESITQTRTGHVFWPIRYIRSFYFLGKIHENRGEMDKAREYYRRFYEYWKDGDMDRERVEEAKSKLGMT